MSERNIGLAVAALVEAFGLKTEQLTPARIGIYVKTLARVPVALLDPMVQRAVSTRTFFPQPAELLQDAEVCRKEMLSTQRYEPCELCELTPGWEPLSVDGTQRLTRCQCWKVHQAKLEALGATKEPLALPPARESELSRIGEHE